MRKFLGDAYDNILDLRLPGALPHSSNGKSGGRDLPPQGTKRPVSADAESDLQKTKRQRRVDEDNTAREPLAALQNNV